MIIQFFFKPIFQIFFITTLSCAINAEVLINSKINSKSDSRTLFAHVVEIHESKTDFLVLFQNDPGLYSFTKHSAKKKLHATLLKSMKEKKPLKIKVEAMSQQIISIEE